MTIRDCYKMSLHTIKKNKARSILTVLISSFLSLMVMGLLTLAISFSNNSNALIKKAYFQEDSYLAIKYVNNRNKDVENQKLFTNDYYDSYKKEVNQYNDLVSFVRYTTSLNSPIEYVDPDYANHIGIKIIEGRNIAPSQNQNEVIVSKLAYSASLSSNHPFTVGSVHNVNVNYSYFQGRNLVNEVAEVEYVVVGIYDELESNSAIVDCEKQFFKYLNFIGDIGIALKINNPNVFITSSTLYYHSGANVTNATSIVGRLNNLTLSLNKILPQAVWTENLAVPGFSEIIYHYHDGASFAAQDKLNENDAIRTTVILIAVIFAIFLTLISVGSLANSISISIDSNKTFIGLLKALGTHNKHLALMVLLESFTLISIGVILGFIILVCLYNPLTSVINMIISFTYNSYLAITPFTASIFIPVYILFITIAVFLLFTYLFSRRSLKKISKTDAIEVIKEVS